MINIDIATKSKKWLKIPKINKFIKTKTLELIELSELKDFVKSKKNYFEISFSLVCDSQIKKINFKFRNLDKPTNVLSFPAIDFDLQNKMGFKELIKNEKNLFLGDIIISIETVQKEAENFNKDFYNHLTHLILHSILHLIGHDHIKEEEAQIMENLEIEILKKINIENPYKIY